jgi:hypothetical protein
MNYMHLARTRLYRPKPTRQNIMMPNPKCANVPPKAVGNNSPSSGKAGGRKRRPKKIGATPSNFTPSSPKATQRTEEKAKRSTPKKAQNNKGRSKPHTPSKCGTPNAPNKPMNGGQVYAGFGDSPDPSSLPMPDFGDFGNFGVAMSEKKVVASPLNSEDAAPHALLQDMSNDLRKMLRITAQ